eukprot:gene4402-7777_t
MFYLDDPNWSDIYLNEETQTYTSDNQKIFQGIVKQFKDNEKQIEEFKKLDQEEDEEILKKYDLVMDYLYSIYYKNLRKYNNLEQKNDKIEATNEILKFKNILGKESKNNEELKNEIELFDSFLIKECFNFDYKYLSNEEIENIYKETINKMESNEFKISVIKSISSMENKKRNISELFQLLKPFIFYEQLKILNNHFIRDGNDDDDDNTINYNTNDDDNTSINQSRFEIWLNYKFQLSNWLHSHANFDSNLSKLTMNHHENIYNWLSTFNKKRISKRVIFTVVILFVILLLSSNIALSLNQ